MTPWTNTAMATVIVIINSSRLVSSSGSCGFAAKTRLPTSQLDCGAMRRTVPDSGRRHKFPAIKSATTPKCKELSISESSSYPFMSYNIREQQALNSSIPPGSERVAQPLVYSLPGNNTRLFLERSDRGRHLFHHRWLACPRTPGQGPQSGDKG